MRPNGARARMRALENIYGLAWQLKKLEFGKRKSLTDQRINAVKMLKILSKLLKLQLSISIKYCSDYIVLRGEYFICFRLLANCKRT